MQRLIEKSELDFNEIEDLTSNREEYPSQDINQLACCLKNAIFSKYVSNYLIEKAEEMWSLYEKRIDRFLKEKQLDVDCNHTCPQTAIKLEELAKNQQENIAACKRDIEMLCSSRKRIRNDVRLQSTQRPRVSNSSIRVPKTPRCIDRYEVTNDIDENHIDEFDDTKRNEIINQKLDELSLSAARNNLLRQCIFRHGEILPLDTNTNTKTRTIRITYLCND